LLLRATNQDFDPETLLNALLNAKPDQEPPGIDRPLDRIAWQVA
jgi:hypothetical protein